jgi:hypothetical protein
MSETATGTFRTTSWQQHPYSEAPMLAVAEKELALDGDLTGTATGRASHAYGADWSNRFAGHVLVQATLGNRTGTLVLEEQGQGSPQGATASWTVLSAGGDLAGLTGSGTWTWEQGAETSAYTLTYDLP